MSIIRHASLHVNCGYARVNIYENSRQTQSAGCRARTAIDTDKRACQFRSQFSICPDFGIPAHYFTPNHTRSRSQFDRDCDKILDGFKSKWRSDFEINRESYLQRFSSVKWSDLSNAEKKRHRLGNCSRCWELHQQYQQCFPLKPIYQPTPAVSIDRNVLRRQGIKKFTSKALSELNTIYEEEVGTTFTEALARDRSIELERKKTPYEKKKEKRNVQRELVLKVNESFAENATITLLAEGESKRKYHRKRLAQSFATPEENPPHPKRQKKHSPNFESVSWDTERLESTLRNWPTGTPINWSAVAREHNIQGGNAGQVAKEFAAEREINIPDQSTPRRRPTTRSQKKKLSGSSISIPANPPVAAVDKEIQSMIASGRFTLGEECAPYKLIKYVLQNGKIAPQEVLIQARKVPLRDIRERLLKKQMKYMRLTPTEAIDSTPDSELKKRLAKLGHSNCDTMTHNELCEMLSNLEHSRTLAMWHDHATILKRGVIMITIHTLYDPAVFLTDTEYQAQNQLPQAVCVQSEVEQPEIYMLSLGSSSVEDQAALIGDRVECLADLSIPLDCEKGKIKDTLRFFTGDHPAAQFEQGTKQGGTYKCGACGCKESMFGDQAHSLTYNWRSLENLQLLAVGGTYGKHPGVLKPFEALKVDELRQELEARGVADTSMTKPILINKLEDILRGVVRVPALLLTDPSRSLLSLNLDRYEVVASEPLHDLKGHIINLITELPYVLPDGDIATQCTHLISCCLAKEKKSGADLRRVVIQLFLLLTDLESNSKTLLLLHTIIKIGEILYSRDHLRSPRQLLQLYNCCWLHMELCMDLFHAPKKLTPSKMFGHYLHALTCHSPTQYELACLRSLNTENQERLFGQARGIAEACTNHHAENIIPQIMIRLQAKQEQRTALLSVEKADTQVTCVAKHLPNLPDTMLKKSFLKHRENSWQLHLKRISPFLVGGEGRWWTHTENGFRFFDGDSTPNVSSGPILLHFRYHTVRAVEVRREECWNKIISELVVIPATSIKLYDSNEKLTGRLLYRDGQVTHQPHPCNPPSVANASSPSSEHDPASLLSAIQLPENLPIPEDNSLLTKNTLTSTGDSSLSSTPEQSDPTLPSPTVTCTSKNRVDLESSSTDSQGCSYKLTKQLVTSGDSPVPTESSLQSAHIVLTANSDEYHVEGLKTTLAASITKIIACDDTLREFDNLRSILKEAKKSKNRPNNLKDKVVRYNMLTAKISLQILARRTELDTAIKAFEHQYFMQHSKLPKREPRYMELLKERNHAKAVLRAMNVSL